MGNLRCTTAEDSNGLSMALEVPNRQHLLSMLPRHLPPVLRLSLHGSRRPAHLFPLSIDTSPHQCYFDVGFIPLARPPCRKSTRLIEE
jgi:hypothetical protein